MLIVNQNNKEIILWRVYADQTEPVFFLGGQIGYISLDVPQAIFTDEFKRTSLFKRCDTSLKKRK